MRKATRHPPSHREGNKTHRNLRDLSADALPHTRTLFAGTVAVDVNVNANNKCLKKIADTVALIEHDCRSMPAFYLSVSI